MSEANERLYQKCSVSNRVYRSDSVGRRRESMYLVKNVECTKCALESRVMMHEHGHAMRVYAIADYISPRDVQIRHEHLSTFPTSGRGTRRNASSALRRTLDQSLRFRGLISFESPPHDFHREHDSRYSDGQHPE